MGGFIGKAMGLDLSLNHCGWYAIDTSIGHEWGYISDVAKYARMKQPRKVSEAYSVRMYEMKKRFKGPINREQLQAHRLIFWRDFALELGIIANGVGIEHICIEDYAYGGKSASTYQIGEASGVVRWQLLSMGFKLRYIMPSQVQKWSCGKPTKAARWQEADVDPRFIMPQLKAESLRSFTAAGDIDGPVTDVVDAFWLADYLRAELRKRRAELFDLESRQIEVLNACTPKQPVNLLTRPFAEITKPFPDSVIPDSLKNIKNSG